jgi:hypothetical protein
MKIHLFLLTALLGLLLGCKSGVDPEPEPDPKITCGVTGTVTFTGQWPANAVELRMITSRVYPPVMADIIYGDSIPMDTSAYNYEFALDPGTYKLVGIAWRNEGADWNFPSICSFYFTGNSQEDSLAPAPVTIANDSDVVRRVNMKVDRSKARIVSAAKITGAVTFSGDWPGDVTEARVIATTRFDLQTLDLPTLNDLALDDESIPKGATTFDYDIPAFPGNFLATFVIFFKADGKITVADVLWSNDHGGLDMDTKYTVALDQTVKGPNFAIDFN